MILLSIVHDIREVWNVHSLYMDPSSIRWFHVLAAMGGKTLFEYTALVRNVLSTHPRSR